MKSFHSLESFHFQKYIISIYFFNFDSINFRRAFILLFSFCLSLSLPLSLSFAMAMLKYPLGRWDTNLVFEDSYRDFESRLHFENRSQLEVLRKLAQPEPWDKELKHLASYIRYTLIRLLQEKKVIGYCPEETPGQPNTLCVNTGLISNALNPIYAVFYRVRMGSEVTFFFLDFSSFSFSFSFFVVLRTQERFTTGEARGGRRG